jgi:hypothetical protein
MSMSRASKLADLRAVTSLALEAGVSVTGVVERMHRTVQRAPGPFGSAPPGRTRGITGFVYGCVRGGLKLASLGVDGLAPWTPAPEEAESAPARDAFISILNGVHGDHLAARGNPLALAMTLRRDGRRVDPAAPGVEPLTGRLLLLVHGLCMNDRQWNRNGHDHGAMLASHAGFTPLYLRYNSGLRIAANGRALSALLDDLVRTWPAPVTEIAIVGHSMGGLVARSAHHHGRRARHAWVPRLTKLAFLGTPHHGAPLERHGRRLEGLMELSPYALPFLDVTRRSAGVRDLATGTVTGRAGERAPLPRSVSCFVAAASHTKRSGIVADRLWGDGLVPLDSALGRHRDARRSLKIPTQHQWVGYGLGHFDLLESRELCAALQEWLGPSPVSSTARESSATPRSPGPAAVAARNSAAAVR